MTVKVNEEIPQYIEFDDADIPRDGCLEITVEGGCEYNAPDGYDYLRVNDYTIRVRRQPIHEVLLKLLENQERIMAIVGMAKVKDDD